jgi:multidrug resistance efflux pump
MIILLTLATSCGDQSEQTTAEPENRPVKQLKKEDVTTEVVALGRVVPEAKIVSIFPEVSGILQQVDVAMGDEVQAGKVLFELDHELQSAQLKQARASIHTQEKATAIVEGQIKKARTNLDYQQREFDRLQSGFDKDVVTKQDLDKQQNLLEQARDDLQLQQAQLANAEARLEELRTNVQVVQAQLDDYFIRALNDGQMLSVELPAGSFVTTNTLLGKFAPASPKDVEAEVDELFAELVEKGQPAYIRPQGKSDTLALAEVVAVAPFLDKKSIFSDEVGSLEDRRVRKVNVRITRELEPLLIGSRVECVIKVQ